MSVLSLRLGAPALALLILASGPGKVFAQSGGPFIITAESPLVLAPPSPTLPASPPEVRAEAFADTVLLTAGGIPLPTYLDLPTEPLEPKTVYRVRPGPWGDLEYYVAYLQVPDHYLDHADLPTERTRWHFPEESAADLQPLLDAIGLPSVGGKSWRLSVEAVKDYDVGGINVFPSAELVEALTPDTRAKLAALLARSKENPYFARPINIESGDATAWFRDSGLSEPIVRLIDKLCYRRGNSLVFSDIAHVSSALDTLADRRQLVRATTRTRSLVLRLKVGHNSDVRHIADYWSMGYKHKAMLPILESVAENEIVEYIDVAHFLPPTPRKLLYTYPSLTQIVSEEIPDCHWTVNNFFRSRPDPTDIVARVFSERFREAFEPLHGELRFGDVITFFDRETAISAHSAVYIAGDIVFTKNGNTGNSPWILMRYTDMLSRYENLFPACATMAFRLK